MNNLPSPTAQLALAGVITLATIAWAMARGYRSVEGTTSQNFFLMNMSAGRWRIGISFATTMISAFLFIGLPGLFYSHGIGGWLYVCLPVIFGVATFQWYGTRVRKLQIESKAVSPFEALSSAYHSKWIGAVSFFITSLFVIPVIAMQLVGIGRLLEPFGVPYEMSLVVLVILFLVYTTFAGMKGDVETDLFQGVLMAAGIVFVACLVGWYYTSGHMISGARAVNTSFHYSLPGPNGLFTFERLVSLAIMMSALPIAHGHYIMRFMVAKDNITLRESMPIAAGLIFLLYLSAAIIGLAGAAVVPGLDSGDKLVGTLLSTMDQRVLGLAVLIGGVIIACIIASALSSVDSQFLALGASAVRDVAQGVFGIRLNDREQIFGSRLVMAVIGLGAVFLALDPPQLMVQLAVFAASGTMPLVPTFIGAACLSRPAKPEVALWSIALGMLTFALFVIWRGADGFEGWHPGVIAFLVSAVVYVLGARLGAGQHVEHKSDGLSASDGELPAQSSPTP